MVRDAHYNYKLGYDVAWMIEHHFSDYYPTPAPISILSHIGAACPGLGLGTMVLVLPWHQPVRLAGELAVLSHLASGELHVGMGRGNAPYEYEAFGLDLAEAKDRFADTWHILERSLTGKPFTYQGTHFDVSREIRIRPEPVPGKLNFYGAIGNPASAQKIAEMRLPPISNGTQPFEVQRQVIANWKSSCEALGRPTDLSKPVAVLCIVADTDGEAYDLARRFIPRWFELQTEHYAYDAARHKDLPDYRPFAEMHERRIKMTDPKNLDPLLDVSFIGSPETVAKRVQTYIDIGFDHFILQGSMPGIPEAHRQRWLRRFAEEVAPRFPSSFSKGKVAALA